MPLVHPGHAAPADSLDTVVWIAPAAPLPPSIPEALDAALRDALHEVVRLHERAALDAAVVDRGRERRWSEAHAVARTALDREVASYTRRMRGAGVPITGTLESVAIAVRAATRRMALGPRDVLVRHAGRWCVKAYYER